MKSIILDFQNLALIASFVFISVLIAISIDLIAGLRKAKQNGNLRTSEALRQTVNKFIQYEGGTLIAFIIDLLLHFCQVWNFVEKINEIPIFTLIIGIYNCVCEFISVRENADRKFQKQRRKIDTKILKIVKEIGTEKIKKIIDILENQPPEKPKNII